MLPNTAVTENDPQASPAIEVPLGHFPYGWTAVATTRVVEEDGEQRIELLPFPKFYNRQFTHEPRTIVLGSPKRGGHWSNVQPKNRRQLKRVNQCKSARYIVWGDRSLRRVDKVIRRQLAAMSPVQQNELMAAAATLGK